MNRDDTIGLLASILALCATIDESVRQMRGAPTSEPFSAWVATRSGYLSIYYQHLQDAAADGDLDAFEAFLRSLISQAVPLSEPPEGGSESTEWILSRLDRLAQLFDQFTAIRDAVDADSTLSEWLISAWHRNLAWATNSVSTRLVRAAQDRSGDLTAWLNESQESERTLGEIRLHLAISRDPKYVAVAAWQSSQERQDLVLPVLIRLEGKDLDYYIILGQHDKFRSTLRFVSNSPTNLATWNGAPIPWSSVSMLEPQVVTRSVAHTSGSARRNWRSVARGHVILQRAVRSGEEGEEKLG